MTDAQSWTLLGLVGVLLSVIGSLLVQQVRQVGDRVSRSEVGSTPGSTAWRAPSTPA